jgi:hypothetical protein
VEFGYKWRRVISSPISPHAHYIRRRGVFGTDLEIMAIRGVSARAADNQLLTVYAVQHSLLQNPQNTINVTKRRTFNSTDMLRISKYALSLETCYGNRPTNIHASLMLQVYIDLCIFPPAFNTDTLKYINGKNYPITGLDRPLGLQEVEASKSSRQSAHDSGKVVSPTYGPPLPPGNNPRTDFC